MHTLVRPRGKLLRVWQSIKDTSVVKSGINQALLLTRKIVHKEMSISTNRKSWREFKPNLNVRPTSNSTSWNRLWLSFIKRAQVKGSMRTRAAECGLSNGILSSSTSETNLALTLREPIRDSLYFVIVVGEGGKGVIPFSVVSRVCIPWDLASSFSLISCVLPFPLYFTVE